METNRNDRLNQLNQFLAENPDDPFLLFALARETEKLGDAEQALEAYRKLASEHPGYIGTYYHFGNLLRTFGKENEAQEVFRLGMLQARKAGDNHALAELQRIAMESDEL